MKKQRVNVTNRPQVSVHSSLTRGLLGVLQIQVFLPVCRQSQRVPEHFPHYGPRVDVVRYLVEASPGLIIFRHT